MKRLLIMTGILLMPSAALAAEPLSPFVGSVLSQADLALQYADSLPVTEGCTASNIASAEKDAAVRRALNPELTSILASDALRSQTLCQRYDLHLLEQKMNQVRDAMHASITGQTCKLETLTSLSFFSYQMELLYTSVLKGGLDPSYADFQLRAPQTFKQTDATAPVCPFTTDYGPPSVASSGGTLMSFGCDYTKLSFILNQDDIPDAMRLEAQQELNATTTLQENAQKTATTIQNFQQTVLTILARLRGKAPPSFPPVSGPGDMEHGVVMGCKADGENVRQVQTWNMKDLPDGVLLYSAYNSFSAEEDTGFLMKMYLALRQNVARLRALPDELKNSIMNHDGEFVSPLQLVTEDLAVINLRNVAAGQARESALYLATDTDALEQMEASMQPLRSAVKSFGFIASFPTDETKQCMKEGTQPQRQECCHYVCKDKKEDAQSCERICNSDTPILPSYVRDFALFIRRSCVDGSCSKLLEKILNRSLNPACYPYGSGCYQRDDYTPDACFKSPDANPPFDCYAQSSSEGE